MSTVTIKSAAGAPSGEVTLDPHWFGVQPNIPVMHQVVVAQLAAARAGTHSTKTRAEISRTSHKSRRQKGLGTSRQGSHRAPHWIGGGVAHGPKPRKYNQRTPKKMVSLALRSALSDRANDGKIVVLDQWGFAEPKTKDAIKALQALGLEGEKVLLVLDPANDADQTAALGFRNLQDVQLLKAGELNAYDVLCNDYIVFTTATLPGAAAAAAGATSPADAEGGAQ